jgi:CRISPR-associated protein Cmr2
MEYLLLISLGPVQDFIMTARRTRDLWFGSYLLSECSKATARSLLEQGCELIFPNPADTRNEALSLLQPNDPAGLGVVNNVLVRVVTAQQNLKDLVNKAREAAEERIDDLFNQILNRLNRQGIDQTTAREQLKDLLEFQWVAVPENGDYERARARAAELLSARKATRNFRAVNWIKDEGIGERPKSSLDGAREAVTETLDKKQRNKHGLREKENLCGVGVLKRMGARGGEFDRFFSTSHVAALPLIRRITKEHRDAVQTYTRTLQDIEPGIELGWVPGHARGGFDNYDGHILFESRLVEYLTSDKTDEGENRAVREDKLKRATTALNQFFATTKLHRPMPYYTLFHADGDRMGEAISSPNLDRFATHLERHKALSRKLSKFADSVRGIVEKHWGSLVFSGGDDVLAFLPLDTALECVAELAQEFETQLQGFTNERGEQPTLSGGLVIAHHLDSLSETLQLARAAEKTAKSIPGKNGLAITLCKRSGADRTVKGRFAPLCDRMKLFTQLHRDDAFPDGAAYDLLRLARELPADPTLELPGAPLGPAQRAESSRILTRKRAGQGTRKISEANRRALERILDESTLEDVAQELIVAKIFAQAQDIANGPIPQQNPTEDAA